MRLHFLNDDGPAALLCANRLEATESLSRDFRFTVEVISDDAGIALKDVQGKMVSVLHREVARTAQPGQA